VPLPFPEGCGPTSFSLNGRIWEGGPRRWVTRARQTKVTSRSRCSHLSNTTTHQLGPPFLDTPMPHHPPIHWRNCRNLPHDDQADHRMTWQAQPCIADPDGDTNRRMAQQAHRKLNEVAAKYPMAEAGVKRCGGEETPRQRVERCGGEGTQCQRVERHGGEGGPMPTCRTMPRQRKPITKVTKDTEA